jgi:hypothetical protein
MVDKTCYIYIYIYIYRYMVRLGNKNVDKIRRKNQNLIKNKKECENDSPFTSGNPNYQQLIGKNIHISA